jgi:hypothetical protein
MSMLERQRRGNSLAQANGLGKWIKNPQGLKGRDKLDTFCILAYYNCIGQRPGFATIYLQRLKGRDKLLTHCVGLA